MDHGLSFWSAPLGSYKDGRGARYGSKHNRAQRCSLDTMACWMKPTSECEFAKSLVGERPHCRDDDAWGPNRKCILRIIGENRSLQEYVAEGHSASVFACPWIV